MKNSNRKTTFSAVFSVLAGNDFAPTGYGSAYSALVPGAPLGYGLCGALQAMSIDNLFPIAQAATNEAATAAADAATDATVLQALAEIDAADADAAFKQLLIEHAAAELATGKHTVH